MIEIIPAIDLRGGRCVRLVQGNFERETVYSGDPSAVAERFAAAGVTRLHLVDLDGARCGSVTHLDVLRRVADAVPMRIDYGGGIRSREDVESVFRAGASIVTVGSLAIKDPQLIGEWISEFGKEKFLIGIDVRDGRAAVSGWTETSEVDLGSAVATIASVGAKRIFVTDISLDGAMKGPSLDLYRGLIGDFPGLELIASGGVRDMHDIDALDRLGCRAVIVGRAIYEGAITLEDIRSACSRKE